MTKGKKQQAIQIAIDPPASSYTRLRKGEITEVEGELTMNNPTNKQLIQIAIDGPVAAGKSTVAKKLADRLGLLYVDTGAMYRALALAAQNNAVAWEDEEAVSALVEGVAIDLEYPDGNMKDGRTVTVILEGEDVSWAIRTQEIGEGASIVSQYPEVRKVLVREQQKLARGKAVVMEGRDIGTRVLPQATMKIFMNADLKERVKRKQNQLNALGQKLTQKKVKDGIVSRDTREETRKVDPLRPAEDAWLLDTTTMTIDEVVEVIVEKAREMINPTELE